MGSSNIRDVLTSFSPNLDLFAITLGDGRIKVLPFSCSTRIFIAKMVENLCRVIIVTVCGVP